MRRDATNSRTLDSRPWGFRTAETTTLVSRTTRGLIEESFAWRGRTLATDLGNHGVDVAHGYLVEALPFGIGLDRPQGTQEFIAPALCPLDSMPINHDFRCVHDLATLRPGLQNITKRDPQFHAHLPRNDHLVFVLDGDDGHEASPYVSDDQQFNCSSCEGHYRSWPKGLSRFVSRTHTRLMARI